MRQGYKIKQEKLKVEEITKYKNNLEMKRNKKITIVIIGCGKIANHYMKKIRVCIYSLERYLRKMLIE